MYGIYRLTPPTLADGQQSQFAVDTAGRLVVAPAGSSDPTSTQLVGANSTTFEGWADVNRIRTTASPADRPLITLLNAWNRTTSLTVAPSADAVSLYSRLPPVAKTTSAIVAGSTTTQQLFAANPTRSKLVIQNQDAAINVFVNLGAAAVAGAGNLRIAPGAMLELTGTNQTVNLIAASGTPAICAWEM